MTELNEKSEKNSYISGAIKVIPAVLIYPKRDGKILMLHRVVKTDDYHAGKWNGLGGKLEAGESPLEAAVRELKEESGLDLSRSAFRPLGSILFPLFKAHKNEDWMVFVFTAEVTATDTAWAQGPEGELEWIAENQVSDLNLWPGDRHFLPHVLAGEPFMGTIWYEGSVVKKHWVAVSG